MLSCIILSVWLFSLCMIQQDNGQDDGQDNVTLPLRLFFRLDDVRRERPDTGLQGDIILSIILYYPVESYKD